MQRTHTVSVGIAVTPQQAYDYASDPANLPTWAPGFVRSIERQGDHWVAETPLGAARMSFAPPNKFGVLDHDVELPGSTFHNPVRVIPNGSGCEVLFTLVQLPEISDSQFDTDLEVVRADLNKLRTVLEHQSGAGSGG
ncbi:MAG: SRPBCC family protein [Burkholderiaceae bacterium]